jgi:peptide/nickel transport system substrate-binding protein
MSDANHTHCPSLASAAKGSERRRAFPDGYRPSTAAAFLAVAMLIAPARLAAQDQPQYGGTLNVGVASDAKSFHPFFSVEFTERQVLYLVFDTLVKYGTDFSIEPGLASSWIFENGGKRVVLKLREGVKFHDGTAFDAAAVKWNFEKRLDSDTASPQRSQLQPIIDSVEVINPATVAINLKEANAGLLSLLGERPGFMVSPAATERFRKDYPNNPVGTGPFVFKGWTRGSQVILEKNRSYWQPGKPYLDRIVFRDIAGSVIGVQRLINGELDFVSELSPNDVRAISNNPAVVLAPIAVGRWYSLQWQVDKPPFDNAKLREAIAHAIDRRRLIDIIMGGKATVSESPTPPGLWWFDPSVKTYPYDPTKAKALLAEVGFPNGTTLTLSAPQISVFQQIDQLAQEQLSAVGIKIDLAPVSSSEWYDRIVKRATNFTPTRWVQRADPDGLLHLLFHSKGYQNTTGYNNPQVDSLLDRARSVTNQDERKKIYGEVQALLAKDIPMLPLFFSTEYAAMRTSVGGFVWIPDQIPRLAEVWKRK